MMKMVKKKFKAVVFDCGNVTNPYCFSKVCYEFAKHARVGFEENSRKALPHEIMATIYCDNFDNKKEGEPLLKHFERGNLWHTLRYGIGAQKFRDVVRARHAMPRMSDETFDQIWNSMFLPYDPGMLNWLKALRAAGYPLIMATNNNAIHMQFLRATYPEIFAQFERVVASQDIGLVKSDGKIFYDFVLVAARSIVKDIEYPDMFYFDDVPEYVETFRQCGGKAVVFRETVPAQYEAAQLGLVW